MLKQRFCALKIATLAAAAFVTANPALAADLHWTGGAGDNRYTTPGNWDAGRAPTESDNVYIYAPETTIITCDAVTAAANYLISTASLNFNNSAHQLLVRGDADIFGNIYMSNGQLTVGGEARVWSSMFWTGGIVYSASETAIATLTIEDDGFLQIHPGSGRALPLGTHLTNLGRVSHVSGWLYVRPIPASGHGGYYPLQVVGNGVGGTWESYPDTDVSAVAPPTLTTTVVLNQGSWVFVAGAETATISSPTSFGNTGAVAVYGKASIGIPNDIDPTTGLLYRGTWSVYNGGQLTTSRPVSEIGPDAFVYFAGAGPVWDGLQRLTTVRGTMMLEEGAGLDVAPPFLNPLVNWGTVTIGADAHLHVIGSYYQKPGATLRRLIDNTGPTPRVGMLDTVLSISLAGEVTFEPYDSGKLSDGDEFPLLGLDPLGCCIVEGQFSTVSTLVPGHVRYEDRVATFVVGDCRVDLNGDGLVDFSDYLEFLNRFDAQDPSVDFNGDGLVDFSDYLEFLNLFDAGC